MSKNCPHGKDLSNQVCKYCSCTHGHDKNKCSVCDLIAAKKMLTNTPAQTCPHGVDINHLCGKCMAAGLLGASGSFNVRIPEDFGMDRVQREKYLKERAYKEKLASLDKVPGAMRMFRTWQLDRDNTLRAMVASYAWGKGENMSTSMSDGGHNGFFGFSSLAELQKQEKKWWEMSQSGEPQIVGGRPLIFDPVITPPVQRWYVSGTFLGYGHMVIAEHGGRSQFAVPEYIIEPDGSDPDFGLRILTVAEKYGMDVISVATARELKLGSVPWWRGKPNK